MHDTWTDRDLPVLQAVVDAFETNRRGSLPDVPDLVEATGFSAEVVLKALDALDGAYLVFKQEGLSTEDPASYWVQAIYPEARRVTGQWPSPERQAEVLLQALSELAEHAPDVETQGKAQKVLKAVGEGGQKFIVELLSSAAAKMVTGG